MLQKANPYAMKNFTLKFLCAIAIIITTTYAKVNAQGCVAIKADGPFSNLEHTMQDTTYKSWELTASWRYFKSFRHFKGTEEQKQRQVTGNEVINHQNKTNKRKAME